MSIGLLLLRLVVGLTLAAHGSQKLFGWFGGGGINGTGQGLEQLGFVPGRRGAIMAGLAESGGGVLLALGALTPVAAAALIGVMVVAIFSVHLKKGFFVAQGGYEYPMVLALAALSLVFTSPGRFSVDDMIGLHLSGAGWAFAALFAGLAGAAIQLAGRHRTAEHPRAQSAAARS